MEGNDTVCGRYAAIHIAMWNCFYFLLFYTRLKYLQSELICLREKSPEKLKGNKKALLYIAVIERMQRIREDPTQSIFQLGNTLGKTHRDWRRAKEGLPSRYRLFFKFFSQEKEIYFAWLNDKETLRKADAKTDCYNIFRWMLDSGRVPSHRDALHSGSQPISK